MPLTFRPLEPADASQVARLHCAAIDTGFLSSLGSAFLTTLYRLVASDRFACGLVAEEDNRIVGFAALTSDIRSLYRSLLCRGALRFLRHLPGFLFSGCRCRQAMETLIYPRRGCRHALPRAELLALAVQPDRRRRSIGRQLVEQVLRDARCRGLTRIKVCVGDTRTAARALYADMGFEHACNLEHHGRTSQIWVKPLHASSTGSSAAMLCNDPSPNYR